MTMTAVPALYNSPASAFTCCSRIRAIRPRPSVPAAGIKRRVSERNSRFKISAKSSLLVRFDVVNLLDKIYQLRDGSGIGVGAPQFGQRRGFYGTVAFDF